MNPQYYKQIIQNAGVGIACHRIQTDDTGNPVDYEFVEINGAYEKYTGLVSAEILHKSTRDLALNSPLTQADRLRIFGDVALNGGVKTLEIYFPTTDRWYEVQVLSPEKFFFTTILSDCTKRKKLEAGLKAEADFWNDVFGRIPGIFFMLRDEGQFVMWNQDLKDYLGASEEQMPALSALNHFAGEDKDTIPRMIRDALTSGSSSAEVELISLEGKASPFFLTCHRISLHEVDYLIGTGQDITERKHIDERLRLDEERLRLALAAGNQGWFDVNFQTGEVSVSPEYVRIIGYKPESFRSSLDEWKASLHPDDHGAVKLAFQECLQTGETRTMEYRRRKADGDWIWLSSVGKIVEWDEDHQPLRMIGTHTDISERKKIEETLAASESRLRDILEAEPECVKLVSADGMLLEMNPAGLRMLEVESLEEAQSFGLLHFVERSHRPDFIKLHQKVMAGESGILEFMITGKKGHQRWLETHATPLRDKEGNVTALLGLTRDITTQKKTYDTLEIERTHLTTLIETLPDLVWLKNAEGVYLSCNRRFENFFGARVDQIIGKTDFDFVDKALADFFREHDRKAMEAGGPSVNEELITFAGDGHQEFLETTKTPMVDSHGNLIGVLGIGHDITKRKKIQDELAASEARMKAILATTKECVKLVSHDGTLVSMNRAGLELIEADTPDVAINHCVYEVLAPEHRQAFKEFNERICEGGAGGCLQFEIIGFKGTRRWMETRAVPFIPPEGGETLQLAFTEEITERKLAESKLKLAANVFTHAREGILITDDKANIVDANQTFSDITGYSREEVIGQNPSLLQSGRQSKEFYALMWSSLIEKGHWYGELWNRRKGGEVFAEMVTISAVYDVAGHVSNYVALFTDITPMKAHQAQLEHIAHFDALTALPNRLLFSDRLKQALIQSQRRDRSLAVAYLDLDGFKAINDTHGHEVGDELLIALSARMKDALREGDTLARMGGDEFVAVLVDLEHSTDYEPVLFRLLNAASAPIRVGDAILNVSASIGVTLSPRDGIEPDQLIRQADQAMYQAKQSGKNRYHLFDIDFDQLVKFQNNTLDNIRQALTRNEFVLYYQPKVVMSTGEVIGAEALIRWNHPEQGILSPAAFLPLIHDHPVSIALGEWVINTALTQMEAWHDAGLDIPVSVNIGARQLQQGDFVMRLSEALAAHPRVKPSCLELEILETSALEDLNLSTEVMHACRSLGVRFALDDFGTGYSSLTYLRYLPADVIKIDQTFVRDMLTDQEDHHIVQAVVELARTFGRDVIAEGVETAAHGNALIELGCEYAQGYAIAKPMPASELHSWVAAWSPEASWLA